MTVAEKILVPVDFSDHSARALAYSVDLAKAFSSSVHLLHCYQINVGGVSPYGIVMPESLDREVREAAERKLSEWREKTAKRGLEVEQSVTPLFPSEAIANLAEEIPADLIVMGTHGHSGIKHAFLGSVAERTLRTIDRPVLAVKEDPAKAEEPITRILLAVDFSAHSDRAVEVAAGLAKRLGASLDVLHAFELPRDYVGYTAPFAVEFAQKIEASASERLESVGARLEETQLPVTLHVRRGYPSGVIAEAAEELGCQLIVMGTRGHTGLSHVMLGSIAERTLRAAPCSVLAVKAEEAEALRGKG